MEPVMYLSKVFQFICCICEMKKCRGPLTGVCTGGK